MSTADVLKFLEDGYEVEYVVLGAMLRFPQCLSAGMDYLSPDHFTHPGIRKVFEATRALFHRDREVSIVSVAESLKAQGVTRLNEKKVSLVLGEAHEAAALSAAGIDADMKVLNDRLIKRSLAEISMDMGKAANDRKVSAESALDTATQAIAGVVQRTSTRTAILVSEGVAERVQKILEREATTHVEQGIPSGFPWLDRITDGWNAPNVIVMAGRPGMGKTAFVVNLLLHAAISNSIPVGFFSLEMNARQIQMRCLSVLSGINSNVLTKGILSEDHKGALEYARDQLLASPFHVDDTPAIPCNAFRARARDMVSRLGCRLIAVDYLQLMRGEQGEMKAGNREGEVSQISQTMKRTAKELDVPVIALAQLNRELEKRANKRPMKSDLRESGAIEQDADQILFLHSEDYFKQEAPEFFEVDVIVDKNRNGATGSVVLGFDRTTTTFREIAHQAYLGARGR